MSHFRSNSVLKINGTAQLSVDMVVFRQRLLWHQCIFCFCSDCQCFGRYSCNRVI